MDSGLVQLPVSWLPLCAIIIPALLLLIISFFELPYLTCSPFKRSTYNGISIEVLASPNGSAFVSPIKHKIQPNSIYPLKINLKLLHGDRFYLPFFTVLFFLMGLAKQVPTNQTVPHSMKRHQKAYTACLPH